MHVAFPAVANDCLGEVASFVRFDIDAQGAVDFQAKSVISLSVRSPAPGLCQAS